MQQSLEEFTLDISKPSGDFTNHLTQDNHRVFFSGPFGSGKTYFLNKYFEPKQRSVIHLYPVNYSVSSNQDIFELIKYDILFELLAKGIKMEKWDFSNSITLHNYLQKHAYDLVKKFVSKFSDVGKNITAIADELLDLIKDYESDHLAQQIDQEEDVIAYLKSFTGKTGNINEEDIYTLLIQELLQKLKVENEKEENILIIDDLDRIDPEHIFRLLNVFSAHFDLRKNQNKFGFDKIILVCDINNIRNIFHAKYGADVDFSGYIDKFYSKEVFVFDNRRILEDNILKFIRAIKFNDNQKTILGLKDSSNYIYKHYMHILAKMINVNAINLRSFVALNNRSLDYKVYSTSFMNSGNEPGYSNTAYLLIVVFDFIKIIVGDAKSLERALIKCLEYEKGTFSDRISRDEMLFLSQIISVLATDAGKWFVYQKPGIHDKPSVFEHESGAAFEYQVIKMGNTLDNGGPHTAIEKIYIKDNPDFPIRIYYFKLLLEAFKTLQKHGMYQ